MAPGPDITSREGPSPSTATWSPMAYRWRRYRPAWKRTRTWWASLLRLATECLRGTSQPFRACAKSAAYGSARMPVNPTEPAVTSEVSRFQWARWRPCL
ncbi:unnamed protein product [Cladocopium goreaui]|uniref:Uncharacterized protein n=1 Tax=Cladocopium goreaui TaxID=2562237 RepID=A0A9P1GIF5_9DINO|nr:unnamed protein product [Cladocopium goreaui]